MLLNALGVLVPVLGDALSPLSRAYCLSVSLKAYLESQGELD